jgi:hypothetical protein
MKEMSTKKYVVRMTIQLIKNARDIF